MNFFTSIIYGGKDRIDCLGKFSNCSKFFVINFFKTCRTSRKIQALVSERFEVRFSDPLRVDSRSFFSSDSMLKLNQPQYNVKLSLFYQDFNSIQTFETIAGHKKFNLALGSRLWCILKFAEMLFLTCIICDELMGLKTIILSLSHCD